MRKALLPLLCVTLSSFCFAEQNHLRGDELPKNIREVLDAVFEEFVENKKSAWETWREERREHHDISPFLKKTRSIEEAARPYGIPGFLVKVTNEQLAFRGLNWPALSMAQRHRVLDYLLAAYKGTRDAWFGPRYLGREFGMRKVFALAEYVDAVAPLEKKWRVPSDFFMVRPGLLAMIEVMAETPGPPAAAVTLVTEDGVSVTEFRHHWKVGSDLWGPEIEGLWDCAMDIKGKVAYCIVRYNALWTTQEPCVLLEMEGSQCVRVKLPVCGLLSCVALSDDGTLLAVGTEAGEVLSRREPPKWTLEQVFAEDGIRDLAIRKGSVIAVSRHGGVARLDEGWHILCKPGDRLVSSCAVHASGDVFLLLADGVVLRASGEKTANVDYRAILPKADAALFRPRAIFAWGNDLCLWGSTRNQLTLIELEARKVWPVPVKVRTRFLFQKQRLEILGAWDDSHVIWPYFFTMRVVNKNGSVSQLQSWRKHMAKKLKEHGLSNDVLEE